jgi:hypothetical protein
MADIRIERRRRPSMWPWVLALIVVVVLVWIIADAMAPDDRDVVDAPPVVPEDTLPHHDTLAVRLYTVHDVQRFLSFVDDVEIQPGRDHIYVATGLERLSAALQAIAARSGIAEERTRVVRDSLAQSADRIHGDPQASGQFVRSAFVTAANFMEEMRQQIFPNLGQQVDQVRSVARQVDPAGTVVDQRTDVERFFNKAGDVVEHMARATDPLPETIADRGGSY